ncbi:ribonucleoside-diphosphate reductase beta chain [Neobacillus niacini]|uniref:R2-like ligand-binding oxidase n=1 Tax=Neobacillus niacini TaxID=86668 RepID=UPI0027814FE6|nr:R2-like ligand-binding oxidase [Neobacillus niacini]MDQ1002174.1 ribonucleoside-diphosphate reductase beta chain [Neobacillus niacini]
MRKEIISLTKGLDRNSFAYQLFTKAKRHGVWNPADIDFTQDKKDWAQLSDAQKDNMRLRFSRFISGEESVTMDILPMIMTMAKKGWIEEELYLTSFLFEEAKHVDLFHILLNELGESSDLSHYHSDSHKKMFYELLPQIMNRLLDDPSNKNIAEAAAFYNMFTEGVQAETGYFGLYEGIIKSNLMPGLAEGIANLKRDESRHIAFGTYLLQRLISEEPELYDFVCEKMEKEWMPIAAEVWKGYASDATDPFGVKIQDVLDFSEKQLRVRMNILKNASLNKMDVIELI